MTIASNNNESVEAHLSRLERKYRELQLGVALLTAVSGLLLFVGATRPETLKAKTVEAREFILRDAEGSVWATLGTDEGYVALTLTDPSQSGRAVLMVNPDGHPGLRLVGRDDRTRVLLTVDEANNPRFLLYSDSGRPLFEAPQKSKLRSRD